jgi:hypothetical protein
MDKIDGADENYRPGEHYDGICVHKGFFNLVFCDTLPDSPRCILEGVQAYGKPYKNVSMDQKTQNVRIWNGNFIRAGIDGQRELEKNDTERNQQDAWFDEIIPAALEDESEQQRAGDEKIPVDHRVQRHIVS